jgi:hypothetical protein
MKKICLTVVGLYVMFIHAFSQVSHTDSTGYKSRKLRPEEVNFISGYYDQSADKSAVMGGRTDFKGNGAVTDLANGLEIKFVGWDPKGRKNNLTAGLGIDYHTAASQAYVDSNGHARNNGTRVYPTLDWSIENEKKGTGFGIGAYYSAEHNYYHSIGLNTSWSKKNQHNGEFSVKVTGYFDQIKMILPSEFIPVDSVKNAPATDSVVYITTASGRTQALTYVNGQPVGGNSKPAIPSRARDTYTASFGFAQVINPRMQGSIALDLVYQSGYLGLPFHRVYLNTGKDTIENLPSQRFKVPIGFRLNYFLGDNVIIRTYYRFYADTWGMRSHTVNIEVPVKLTPFFSISPFYRYYRQTAADYFAPYEKHLVTDQYYTSNYTLSAFTSQTFGAGFRMAPPKGVVGHLKVLEIRYAHYTQTTDLTANTISMAFTFK